MEDYSTADPTQQINNLLGGGSGEPLIPESLQVFLIISFVIINILTIVFMIFWIMGMVRRWKVQTAILRMQKDVAEIKESLAQPTKPASVEKPIFIEPQSVEPDSNPASNTPTN